MWKRALTLAVGIVMIASMGGESRGAKDVAGNEFTWDAGYPKKGTIFVPFPPPGFTLNAAVTNYGASPANTWNVTKITFDIKVYADAAGTQLNGTESHMIQVSPWSDEYKWSIFTTGVSFRVKNNICIFTDGFNVSNVNAGDLPAAGQNGIAFP